MRLFGVLLIFVPLTVFATANEAQNWLEHPNWELLHTDLQQKLLEASERRTLEESGRPESRWIVHVNAATQVECEGNFDQICATSSENCISGGCGTGSLGCSFLRTKRSNDRCCVFLSGIQSETVSDILDSLPASVEHVEEDLVVSAATYQYQSPAPWGLNRIRDYESTDQYGTWDDRYQFGYEENAGEGVKIYVADTGMDLTWAEDGEFQGRILEQMSFVDHEETAQDFNGHGTATAGCALGTQYGVAKAAQLVVLKVLDGQGYGYWSGIKNMLQWVGDHCKHGEKCVLNLSLSTTLYDAYNREPYYEAIRENGVVSVAAAGNDNRDAETSYPAFSDHTISVGATNIQNQIAWFSNYGPTVDVYAPGQDIVVPSLGGNWNSMSGTSFACPYVAGLVAVMMQRAGRVLTMNEVLNNFQNEWGVHDIVTAPNNQNIPSETNYFAQQPMPSDEQQPTFSTTPRPTTDDCDPNNMIWNCCSPEKPCPEGEGDCDIDEDCLGDLVCEENAGPRYGGPSFMDICADPNNGGGDNPDNPNQGYGFVFVGKAGNAWGGAWSHGGYECNEANQGKEIVVWEGSDANGYAYGWITHSSEGDLFDLYRCDYIVQCPSEFERAVQLYCNGSCGDDWLDNEHGCQQSDADTFCKFKLCNENAYAISFDHSTASHEPGFACDGYGESLGDWFGVIDVQFKEDLRSNHFDGDVVANVVCHDGHDVDCEGHWEDWSECDAACEGGEQTRTFHITVPVEGFGNECDYTDGEEETRECNTHDCPECDGVNINLEVFTNVYEAEIGFYITDTCQVPTDTFDYASYDYIPDLSLVMNCCVPYGSTLTCLDTYGDGWNGGYLLVNGEDKYCEGEFFEKDEGVIVEEPVDCIGSWTKWGDCSVTCGEGVKSRTYNVDQFPLHGGKECKFDDGEQDFRDCQKPECKVCYETNDKCTEDSDCCDGLSCFESFISGVFKCKAKCPRQWQCWEPPCKKKNKSCVDNDQCCDGLQCFEKRNGEHKCRSSCPNNWDCKADECKPKNKRCESDDECCDDMGCFESKTQGLYKCRQTCPQSWNCWCRQEDKSCLVDDDCCDGLSCFSKPNGVLRCKETCPQGWLCD